MDSLISAGLAMLVVNVAAGVVDSTNQEENQHAVI